MVDKNEKWSVNSGKWAYAKSSPAAADPAAASSRRKAVMIAALVALAGVGLAASVWLGGLRLPGLSLEMLPPPLRSLLEPGAGSSPLPPSQPSTTAAPSPDASRLEAENAELRRKLEETQRTLDEKQQVIDRQAQEIQGTANTTGTPAVPPEYSVIKTTNVTRNLRDTKISADHRFVTGQEHWVGASCYFTPVVDGVTYWIELARRDQPDFAPKTRLADPETLSRANFSWPDIFNLASNCPWLDGAHYTAEELSSMALTERSDTTQTQPETAPVPPLPPVASTPVEPTPPEPDRGSRQVFQARDMIGSDITKLSGISQTECEALCINDRSCQGYTYDNWNRLCITKSGVNTLRIEPRSTTVIFSGTTPSVSSMTPTMTMRRGRAFRDSAYKFALASSYETCASMCMQDDTCLGVNFNQASSQCQFFAAPSEYEPSSGITLGYKSQPPY